MNTSVNELLKLLPNLNSLAPLACEFEQHVSTPKSRLPSPSDKTIQIFGWLQLSESNLIALKSSDEWMVIDANRMPPALREKISATQVRVSAKWNEGFNSNPIMAHGVLLLPDADKDRKVWFYSQDMDHPLSLGLTLTKQE